jgi:hypothetical protein
LHWSKFACAKAHLKSHLKSHCSAANLGLLQVVHSGDAQTNETQLRVLQADETHSGFTLNGDWCSRTIPGKTTLEAQSEFDPSADVAPGKLP